MDRIKVTRQQAQPILAKSFPGYKGRKFAVEFAERKTLSDMNWSGGTKYSYVVLDRKAGAVGLPDQYAPWDERNLSGRSIELSADRIVVEHCMFCGKDLGIRIYMHPSLAPRWLPPPTLPTSGKYTAEEEAALDANAERMNLGERLPD